MGIGHRGIEGQIAIAKCRKIGGRDGHAPGQTAVDGRGVAFATHGNGHSVARRCARHAPAQSLINRHFGVIDQVVTCEGIDNDLWKRGVHQQVGLGGTAVAHAVGAAHANGVESIRQVQHVGDRNLHGPYAVFNGGLIGDIVEGNGHRAAVRQVTGAG